MATAEYLNARHDQSIMMRQGRSFSGHERNCCFLNTADGRFADISATSGFDFPDDGRAVAAVDWDRDGRLDLWVSNRNAPRLRFLRNQSTSGNRWIAIRLRGNAVTTNADGIGARVRVDLDGTSLRPLTKTVRSGEGFLAQSSKWLHFGLRDEDRVKGVTVDWPGGPSESFTGCQVNQRYELRQGTGRANVIETAAHTSNIAPSPQRIEPVSSAARIPLTTPTPMISIRFQDLLSEASHSVALGQRDHSTLLVLWASWCPTCLAELAALKERIAELKAANIRVVALCVDRIADTESAETSRGVELVKDLRLPYESGWASQQLVDQLQLIHDSYILMSHPLPVPSSFLVDPDGQLEVIYKGPAQVEWLLADVTHSQRPRAERFLAAAPIPGRVIDHPLVMQAMETNELMMRLRLARAFRDTGHLNVAARHFREAAKLAPRSSHAHFGLGDVALRQDRLTEAIGQLQTAIALNDRDAEAHFRLALALEKQRQYAAAVSHYRRGLAIMPSFIEGANNLAWILATNPDVELRNGQEAVKWAEKCAAATDYRNAGILDSLAASYAEVGQYPKAAQFQAQAIKLVPRSAQRRYVQRYQLYKSGKPYRTP